MVRNCSDTSVPHSRAAAGRQEVVIPAAHPVPTRVHRPPAGLGSRPGPGWLVRAHGGSQQYGSAAQRHTVTHRLASLSGRNVLSVDDRLALKYSYPAALEDLRTALSSTAPPTSCTPVLPAVAHAHQVTENMIDTVTAAPEHRLISYELPAAALLAPLDPVTVT
ncbi:alpha/beta hydrolase fold domain-containing protein [Streptomyces sp. NPDC047973]|uniref:alpha/beta hydrolase n=1 Tax=Streptomyces sp. NPDC047973 TaxID=3155383 RepID=UPI0034349F30